MSERRWMKCKNFNEFQGISMVWDANVAKTKEIQTFHRQTIEIPLKFFEIPWNSCISFICAHSEIAGLDLAANRSNENHIYIYILPGPALGLPGPIWSYLKLSGAIWSYLELSGAIWCYLKLSRAIWSSFPNSRKFHPDTEEYTNTQFCSPYLSLSSFWRVGASPPSFPEF